MQTIRIKVALKALGNIIQFRFFYFSHEATMSLINWNSKQMDDFLKQSFCKDHL